MVIVEKLVEWRLAGETEVLGENLPQRHFIHQKSHMTEPGWASAVGSKRLTAWAMARPQSPKSAFLFGYEVVFHKRTTKYVEWKICIFEYLYEQSGTKHS
jgi:hypothetical protein